MTSSSTVLRGVRSQYVVSGFSRTAVVRDFGSCSVRAGPSANISESELAPRKIVDSLLGASRLPTPPLRRIPSRIDDDRVTQQETRLARKMSISSAISLPAAIVSCKNWRDIRGAWFQHSRLSQISISSHDSNRSAHRNATSPLSLSHCSWRLTHANCTHSKGARRFSRTACRCFTFQNMPRICASKRRGPRGGFL